MFLNVFLEEYRAGRTPNPDIWCNREIKFKAFLDYALSLGAFQIATGHYARIRQQNNTYELLKGVDSNKDQSYFLYTLKQKQLASSLFPVGELHKSDVRKLAEYFQFKNHAKKDSTGICFIGERKFKNFLQHYLPAQPGLIMSINGKKLGEHSGLMYYTIGQRQGLGIGGTRGEVEKPWYVVRKDIEKNQLIVAQGHEHPALFNKRLICRELSFVSECYPQENLICSAKIRYRSPNQSCLLTQTGPDEIQLEFSEPQWAITEGQSVVFYQQDVCLGGGIIQYAFLKPIQRNMTILLWLFVEFFNVQY